MCDDTDVVVILPPNPPSYKELRIERSKQAAKEIRQDPNLDPDNKEELARLSIIRAGYIPADMFEDE